MRKQAIYLTIIVALFLILFTGCDWFGTTNNNIENSNNNTNAVTENKSNVPSALVGTWKSVCLTPDPESPWSEMHQFEIDAEDWATHTRWDWDQVGCDGSMNKIVNEYLIEFPTEGQINLTDMEEGVIIYDIYSVGVGGLYFGHGFRNNSPSSPNYGGSAADRISTLNEYIKYQKISNGNNN